MNRTLPNEATSATRRRPRLHGMALCALAALLAACRGGGDPPRPVHRLTLAPPPGIPREEAKLVARLLPPEPDGRGLVWGVGPSEGRRVDTPSGAAVLRVDAEATVRVRIPCELDGDEVCEVRLVLTDRRRQPLALHLLRRGRRIGLLHGGLSAPRGRARLLRVPIPELRNEAEPADALELVVPAREGELDLYAVELWSTPVLPESPAPGERPPFVAIGSDARRAFGLSSRRPLSGSAQVPAGGELVLEYGVPAAWVVRRDEAVQLSFEIESGGRVLRYAVPLDRDPQRTRWRTFRLGPPHLAAGSITLRLAIECEGPQTAYAAIARPRIVVPLDDPPTVLLVTSDTHRADHVGFDPHAVRVETPTLDRLAREGVVFERAFSATNVTNPSHVALLTGVSPRDSRVFDNYHPISDAAETLAERFAEAGFTTVAAVSSRHLRPRFSGLGQGFDRFDGPVGPVRPGAEAVAAAVAALDHHRGEPLFVWLHVFDAHTPYDPPADVLARYWPADRDPRDPSLPPLPIDDQLPDWLAGVRDPAYPAALYAAEVAALDAALEPALFHPRARRGVTVLTADHGESLGEHETYYDHGGLYTQTVRVPLVLRWPNCSAGARVAQPVSLLSLPKTLSQLAGLGAGRWPGHDLTALVGREGPLAPCFLVSSNRLTAAIVDGRWLLSLQLRDGSSKRSLDVRRRHDTRLYDLEADPACEHDLANERPEVAAALRRRLIAWLREEQDLGWTSAENVSEELVSSLSELGYTGPVPLRLWDQPLWKPDDCEWCRRFR